MVAGMRWQDIDIGRKLWRVPPEFMKSGRELLVPLSGLALRIIESVAKVGGNVYVFPAASIRKKPEEGAQPVQRHVFGLSYGKRRSEEHTSDLQSLMRISYAVFCLKKKMNNMKTYLVDDS